MDEGSKPQVGAKKPHSIRVHVLFTQELLDDVDTWAREQGASNRNEAIRLLLRRGMK